MPGISRKKDAVDFINEFTEYGSNINKTGGIQSFLDEYEDQLWEVKLEFDRG